MQTFLPYPEFEASARVLDSARLGKQRLECLQALRALVLPVYGWSTHPAARMWRGHLPALVRYSLAVIDEWTERGNVDAIRWAVLEFASDVDRVAERDLDLPPWLGSSEFHDSHRSNLVRKLPEHYRPYFPDVPDGLPYLWPGSDLPDGADAADTSGRPLDILRARTVGEFDEWTATGVVTLPARSPNGTRSPVWAKQHEAFGAVATGDRLGVLHRGVSGARSGSRPAKRPRTRASTATGCGSRSTSEATRRGTSSRNRCCCRIRASSSRSRSPAEGSAGAPPLAPGTGRPQRQGDHDRLERHPYPSRRVGVQS